MKILSFIQKGTAHPNFCEDFLLTFELSENFGLFAVFDGCSSGQDSHFVSSLFGKIFKKIAQKKSFELFRNYDTELSIAVLSEQILSEFWSEIKSQKGQLLLETEELLSTFLLAIYDKKSQKLILNIAGDGCFCVNGEITFLNQNNRPNYPAFHLSKPFEEWFEKEILRVKKFNVSDFAITSDGIESFVKNDDLSEPISENPSRLFLTQTEFLNRPNPLLWQFRQLEKEDILPFDDLSIIRVINP